MDNTAASSSRPRLAGLKVLVIDDSKTIRRTAETLLAREGCEVFTAVDGFDALSKIADHQPDIVFVDIMMPRLDGYQTCQLIKNNKKFRDTPVIMPEIRVLETENSSLKMGIKIPRVFSIKGDKNMRRKMTTTPNCVLLFFCMGLSISLFCGGAQGLHLNNLYIIISH